MAEDNAVPYLRIHPDDNVLVALKDLPSGTLFLLDDGELTLGQDVPAKHKFYVNNMNDGDPVMMYGALVGKVQGAIPKGG